MAHYERPIMNMGRNGRMRCVGVRDKARMALLTDVLMSKNNYYIEETQTKKHIKKAQNIDKY